MTAQNVTIFDSKTRVTYSQKLLFLIGHETHNDRSHNHMTGRKDIHKIKYLKRHCHPLIYSSCWTAALAQLTFMIRALEGAASTSEARISRPSFIRTAPRMSSWNRAEKKWSRAHVGRQGSYSVERLELLDHYCNNTSLTRVILVCLLTPLPSLAVTILIECLPLRPPSEGWAANWMFWIRISLILLFSNIAGSTQSNLFVPGFTKSFPKILIESAVVGALQVGTFILEAVIVGFPVPFMWQLGAITMGIYVPIVTRMMYGPAIYTKGSPFHLHHKRLLNSFLVHLALTVIYPWCRVLYDLTPQAYRGVVVLIIPVWKFAAKRFAVHMTRELEDFIPEIVAFSVDFFSALFVSVCMSTTGSFHLTALFIALDLLFSLLKFHELHKNEKIMLQLLDDRRRNATAGVKARLAHKTFVQLIPILVKVIRNPVSYHVTSLERVRLWASPPHRVPENLYKQLQALGASGIFGDQTSSPMQVSSYKDTPRYPLTPSVCSHVSVVPAPISRQPPPRSESALKLRKESSVRPTEPSKYIVLHGLQLLFHCEYLVLVEYIECVVPLFFVTYRSVLEQLPNVVYFPGGAGKWSSSAVTNLLVFVVLEIFSLVLLLVYLQRKFGFSSLYQLGFVLETQFTAIQAHLFPLTIFFASVPTRSFGCRFFLSLQLASCYQQLIQWQQFQLVLDAISEYSLVCEDNTIEVSQDSYYWPLTIWDFLSRKTHIFSAVKLYHTSRYLPRN